MPSPPAGTSEDPSSPSVWVLLGHKAGDNEQVLALAESLGTGFERRELRYRATELASNVLLGPNLLGVQARHRIGLEPPWPRLVISSGRRNEPVARWIRRQADHPVRLVHVGRPWADPDEFDLRRSGLYAFTSYTAVESRTLEARERCFECAQESRF